MSRRWLYQEPSEKVRKIIWIIIGILAAFTLIEKAARYFGYDFSVYLK